MTNRSTTTRLFIFLLCIYALTAGGHYGGDGFWNYLTAQSLMRDGDLVISDESFTLPEMQKHYNAVTSSGRQYSKYSPGLPLVEIPFYAIGLLLTHIFPNIPADYLTMFTTSMTNVVISALWVLYSSYLIIQSFNYPPSTVKWLTGAFALGTMVLPILGIWISRTARWTRLAHRNTQPHQTPPLTHPCRDWSQHCHPHQILHTRPSANPPPLSTPQPIFQISHPRLLITHYRSLSSHRLSQPPALRQHLTHRISPRHTRPKRRLSRLYTHTDSSPPFTACSSALDAASSFFFH